MKKCKICQQEKSTDLFHKRRDCNAFSSYCKECERKKNNERKKLDSDDWMGIICGDCDFLKFYL